MAIKNFVKLLILVMFLTLFAKMTKKRGRQRVGGGEGGGGKQTRLNIDNQKKKNGPQKPPSRLQTMAKC